MLWVRNSVSAYRLITGDFYDIKSGEVAVLMDYDLPIVVNIREELRLTGFSIEILWVPKIFDFVWTLTSRIGSNHTRNISAII